MDAERQSAHRDRRSHHCINLLMMIFSPWLATHDPNAIDLPPAFCRLLRRTGLAPMKWDGSVQPRTGRQSAINSRRISGVAIAGMIGSLLGCLSGVLGGAQTPSSCASWTLCCRFLRWSDNGTGCRSRAEFV